MNKAVNLNDLQVSDLFFNFGITPGYNPSESPELLKDDATQFASYLGMDNDADYIDALVSDFQERV